MYLLSLGYVLDLYGAYIYFSVSNICDILNIYLKNGEIISCQDVASTVKDIIYKNGILGSLISWRIYHSFEILEFRWRTRKGKDSYLPTVPPEKVRFFDPRSSMYFWREVQRRSQQIQSWLRVKKVTCFGR